MAARGAALLLAAGLALLISPAAGVISCGGKCYDQYYVEWGVGTLGPICMCPGNATAIFTWSGTADHGVFQIPSDACPGNYTAWKTDTYQELAPVSQVGSYSWQLPNKLGDVWVTSQANQDCADGILAQFRITSSGSRSAVQLAAAVAATAAAVVLSIGL